MHLHLAWPQESRDYYPLIAKGSHAYMQQIYYFDLFLFYIRTNGSSVQVDLTFWRSPDLQYIMGAIILAVEVGTMKKDEFLGVIEQHYKSPVILIFVKVISLHTM